MSSIITIDEIQEGMIISDPVMNNFGLTLIPAGTVLKENHKRLLKTWNIRAVTIKDEDNDDELELPEETRIAAEEVLKQKMKWTPRNQIEHNLLQAAIIHVARKMLKTKEED